MLKQILKDNLPTGLVSRMRIRALQPIELRLLRAAPESWTARNIVAGTFDPSEIEGLVEVEEAAIATDRLGKQPLWEGYAALKDYARPETQTTARSSEEVRTGAAVGRFYVWLVRQRRPSVIVEFGTAFGVSGMYWLAGLKDNGHGHLYTFEPNDVWANIAAGNLARIGNRFTLTRGTFEGSVGVLARDNARIDLAFIDAIHTSDFVLPQMELVLERAAPGALLVFDDIHFSDDMLSCWRRIADDARFAAAFEIHHVGVVELR
jgi:predicted O-methyltransferase YrrM